MIGVPVDGLGDADAARVRALAADRETCFLQQREDVTGSAAALRALLPDDACVLEACGSDHRYALPEVLPILASWRTP